MGMRNLLLFNIFIFICLISSGQSESSKVEFDSLINYEVKKKETLYSISNKFNLQIDDIIKYNPELNTEKLKKKAIIIIPLKKTLRKIENSKIVDKIISNDTISEPLKLKVKKDLLKVAYLAPFKMPSIEIDSVENLNSYLKEINLTTISINFYNGIIHAIDELKKNNVSVDLDVFDTDNNISQVEIIREEIIENSVDDFRLTDKNIIEFLYNFEKNNKENKVRIYTDFGQIDILLYNNTPYHRSNFIFLVKKKYFEGTQFYRVINNFVIQAGNSDNISVSKKRKNIGKYLLPNDFNKGHYHKRGALSMPSSSLDNPYKMASPFEFFIVQKKDGANHLDGKYTVFGEVIKGMDTVDKIASIPTDEMDWPINNVLINKVEIIY